MIRFPCISVYFRWIMLSLFLRKKCQLKLLIETWANKTQAQNRYFINERVISLEQFLLSSLHKRGRICDNSWGNKGSCVAHENFGMFQVKQVHSNPFMIENTSTIKYAKNPKVPWSKEAHQYKIWSDLTSCWGQHNPSVPLFHWWADCRHIHQSAWKRKVSKV